ncbi:uncharacterized protein BDR25DRAFT_361400 [Lindgomyces ingoldianus]|uniref:Uncharacterized protein n=1 Tax=Lindgomyces ingoldianus TaxID=673940 RepID=A0ACB6QCD8_9PLEO|nr:uncharacterized protein BDR25DRAFT_361400 [Lindgomyces ingoldianus]KAF2464561.1 hypothetical protein BDR25DRAFT_361400 [Lindgomyces ingoldianus]
MGPLLVCFFSGLGFTTCIIILPQHYQVVFRDSPPIAGYHLLVMTLVTPLGSAFHLHHSWDGSLDNDYTYVRYVSRIRVWVLNYHGIRIWHQFSNDFHGCASRVYRASAVDMGISNQLRVLGGKILDPVHMKAPLASAQKMALIPPQRPKLQH